MRRSFVVMVGFLVASCGAPEESKTPATEATQTQTPAPTPPTAEAPKTEAPKQAKLSPAEAQKKTMAGYEAAFAARDAQKAASFYTEDGVVKMAGAPDVSGRAAIAGLLTGIFAASKDDKTPFTRTFTKGDVMIGEWVWAGTQTGDLMGVKPTGKPFGVKGVSVYKFSPEGLLKETHVYFDAGTLMAQLGVSKQKARAIQPLPTDKPMGMTSTGGAEEKRNVDAVAKMMGAFEKKSDADFLSALADDIAWDDMSQPETMKGKASGQKFFKMMTTAFPDAKITGQNVWGVGDYVIHEGTMTGTQKGALGPIRATKKPVNLHDIDIIQFNKDGKVVKGWTYGNSAEMMMQLGLLPMPGADKGAKPGAKPEAKPVAKPVAKPEAKSAPKK